MIQVKDARRMALVVAVLFGGLAAGCGPINWEYDHQVGLQKAVQNRQRALIEFVSGFDQGANQMDSEVFSDPDVQHLMRRFVPIRLDLGMNRELAQQFGVEKTPAFVVVRPDLSVAGATQGTMAADEFRRFLIRNSLN